MDRIQPDDDRPLDAGPLTPVAPRERLATLDVLRGCAMFGVLQANLYWLYSLRLAQRGKPQPSAPVIDEIAAWFMQLVIEGRAQTLLTLLFGFGFAAQLLRAQARSEPVMPIYLRRLFALLAIGWLHVLFLSWVDVTWGYALVGFSLLLFVRCSNRTRVIVALACTILPSILYSFPSIGPTLHQLLFSSPRPTYIDAYVAAVHGGDRIAILHAHAVMALLWTFGGGVAWYLPWLLGRFLLGYVVGAKRWFDRDGADHLPLFRRMLVVSAIATSPGLTLQILEHAQVIDHRMFGTPGAMVLSVISQLSLLAQVAMYVAIVVLLMQRAPWRKVLGALAPVGRMPLTTYLMQSLICTSLFYGWGLHWSTPAPAPCIALGFAIFAVQIAISHLWLRWFRFGPAEWVWRSVVYLRPQPMRVSTVL